MFFYTTQVKVYVTESCKYFISRSKSKRTVHSVIAVVVAAVVKRVSHLYVVLYEKQITNKGMKNPPVTRNQM